MKCLKWGQRYSKQRNRSLINDVTPKTLQLDKGMKGEQKYQNKCDVILGQHLTEFWGNHQTWLLIYCNAILLWENGKRGVDFSSKQSTQTESQRLKIEIT